MTREEHAIACRAAETDAGEFVDVGASVKWRLWWRVERRMHRLNRSS